MFDYDYYMGENQMSVRQYNLTFGGCLLWGLAINAIICATMSDVFMGMNPIALLIGYFVLAIIGIFMNRLTDNAVVSFIGYNLVVLPMGAVLSVCLAEYSPALVANAMISTAIVVLTMVVIAIAKPELFCGLDSALFISLALSIVVELVMMLCGMHLAIMDWVVLVIFCLYIGYDWNVMNSRSCTACNAVCSALDLYLDIINIFIRILSIVSRSSSSSSRGRN